MRAVEVDDFASFTLGLEGGAVVEASCSSVAPGRPGSWFEIVGSEGKLLLDDDRFTVAGWRDGDEEDLSVGDPARDLEGLPNPLWAPAFIHYAREIVAAIEAGRTEVPGAATFRDGARVQAVLDAARRSAERGARATVQPAG